MATWPNNDDFLDGLGIPHGEPTIEGTTGGGHAQGSYHYDPPGSARDYGTVLNGGVDGCWAIFNAFLPYAIGSGTYIIAELIWRDIFWKRGIRIGATTGHWDHVHSALEWGRLLPITAKVEPIKVQPVYFDELLAA